MNNNQLVKHLRILNLAGNRIKEENVRDETLRERLIYEVCF